MASCSSIAPNWTRWQTANGNFKLQTSKFEVRSLDVRPRQLDVRDRQRAENPCDERRNQPRGGSGRSAREAKEGERGGTECRRAFHRQQRAGTNRIDRIDDGRDDQDAGGHFFFNDTATTE